MSLRATYALELAAIVAVAVLAFFAGRVSARRRPRTAALVSLASALPFLVRPLADRFPALLALPQPVPIAVDLVEAAGSFLLGAASVLAWRRAAGRVAISILVFFAAWSLLVNPASLLVLGPRFASFGGRRGTAHVRQSSSQTCAPACAATVLERLGVEVTEGEMARRCRTGLEGTDHFRLVRALETAAADRGVRIEWELLHGLSPADLLELPPPAILRVRFAGFAHVVTFLGTNEAGRVEIGDPALPGLVRLPPGDFAAEYEWRGVALRVARATAAGRPDYDLPP